MSEEQEDVGLQEIIFTADNPDIDTIEEFDMSEPFEVSTEEDGAQDLKDVSKDETSDNDEKLADDISTLSENASKSSSKSRELKMLLALSKEANLDTNIAYKRKSVDVKVLERNINESNFDDNLNKQKMPHFAKIDGLDFTMNIAGDDNSSETKDKDNIKISKRKIMDEPVVGGASAAENGKKFKIATSSLNIIVNNKRKDPFCWICHQEDTSVFCKTCPRSFHSKCLKQWVNRTNAHRFLCPECDSSMKAENLKEREDQLVSNCRSPAMQGMSLVHLCGLLKFALKRMMEIVGSEPFIHPVSEAEFPEYKSYVVQPMDLTCLEKNIKANVYGSTQAFESDAKWLLHNSIIFNSPQSKLTLVAKQMLKICKQEMSEIENCATCYLNANTKFKTWFIEVCPKPHLLVWAKLKGFPYWPAKAMRTNSAGMVDVRFFGAHDRAWVSFKDCFLFSLKDPNSNKYKRFNINESLGEVKLYIENLEKMYGKFCYADIRVPFELDQDLLQLQQMLPNYDPNSKPKPRTSRRASNKSVENGSNSPNKLEEIENKSTAVFDQNATKLDTEIDCKENPSNKDTDSFSSDSFLSTPKDNTSPLSNRIKCGGARVRGGLTNTTGKLKIISITGVKNGCTSKKSDSSFSSNLSSTSLSIDTEKSNDSIPSSPKELLPEESPNMVMPLSTNKMSDILMRKLSQPIIDSDDANTMDCPSSEAIENVVENVTVDNVSEEKDKTLNASVNNKDKDKNDTNENIKLDTTNELISSKIVKNVTDSRTSTTLSDLTKSSPTVEALKELNVIANVSSPNNDLEDDSHKTIFKELIDETVKSNSDSVNETVTTSNGEKTVEKMPDLLKVTSKRKKSEEEANEDPCEDLSKKAKVDSNTKVSDLCKSAPVLQKSILKSRLAITRLEALEESGNMVDHFLASESNSSVDSITIKNEPLSDDEASEIEISNSLPECVPDPCFSKNNEKPNLEIKVVDNLAKVINEVATNNNQSLTNQEITITRVPKVKGIFIKPLSKMQSTTKQRARKTFPTPPPTSQIKTVYNTLNIKSIAAPKTILPVLKKDFSKTSSPKAQAVSNKTDSVLFVKSTTNGSFVPTTSIIYSGNTGSANINVTTQMRYDSLSKELVESQNYIPQSGAMLKTVNSLSTINSAAENPVAVTTIPSLAPLTSTQTNSTSILDELQVLSSMVPEPLNKAISDLMFRPPPKLKPRPPGPLSMTFDEGLPSSAGNVMSKVNSISHRLGDYFRGMLIELLQDMGKTNTPEAEIANLKLEIEQLKHKHSEELLEIKKNIGSVLKDVQKSILDERNRVIEEIRTNCEAECVKRVEEAKSKQWCANCFKEAQFYCCWNTSYCDYPCQQKHWLNHMSKCAQSKQNQSSTSNNNSMAKGQQLLLRPAVVSKNFTKSIVSKPTKVVVNNRAPNNKQFNFSGNHLTLVESTPGSFEILGNGGPISVGGKFITGLGKVKTTATSVIVTSSTATGPTLKAVTISQAKPATVSSPKHVASVVTEVNSD